MTYNFLFYLNKFKIKLSLSYLWYVYL